MNLELKDVILAIKKHMELEELAGTENFLIKEKKTLPKKSLSSLKNEFEKILYKLYLQITSNSSSIELAKWALETYTQHINSNKNNAKSIINTENRQYLAGYGQMAFMLFLKSLIDPSYFRVEEKRLRGMALKFAKDLVENIPDPTPLPQELIHEFYNSIDSLFLTRDMLLEQRPLVQINDDCRLYKGGTTDRHDYW